VKDVFIYDAIRSARTRAKANGGLHPLTPPELLKPLYEALAQRNQLDPARVSEVILGCVTQHGEQAGNIAKTSASFAGWPESVSGLTVHRFCSSSIDAIALAGLKVATGRTEAVVAGGVEMMSRVPMLSDAARVFSDPAYAVQHQMLLMGSGADLIATRIGASREDCDAVALQSQQRAALAQQEGRFQSIIPIETPGGMISEDECIRADMTAERLAKVTRRVCGARCGGRRSGAIAKVSRTERDRARSHHGQLTRNV
jgi:acetyl-CoA C-acetyltransferase